MSPAVNTVSPAVRVTGRYDRQERSGTQQSLPRGRGGPDGRGATAERGAREVPPCDLSEVIGLAVFGSGAGLMEEIVLSRSGNSLAALGRPMEASSLSRRSRAP